MSWHVVPAMQVTPQAPQLPLTSRRSSQPVRLDPSQSPQAASQVIPHDPVEHTGVECCLVGHTAPHPPQFNGSVRVLTSQPSARLSLLQSA